MSSLGRRAPIGRDLEKPRCGLCPILCAVGGASISSTRLPADDDGLSALESGCGFAAVMDGCRATLGWFTVGSRDLRGKTPSREILDLVLARPGLGNDEEAGEAGDTGNSKDGREPDELLPDL